MSTSHSAPALLIRPYQPDDEAGLLRVWNRALVADPINAATWRAKVLLDSNFDSAGCLIAVVESEVTGFILSIRRRVPLFNAGLEPTNGWITAFGVDPAHRNRGISSALLHAALERLAGLGVRRVGVSDYVPNYFTPGVDVSAYSSGLAFLGKRGFSETQRPISMQADLTTFTETPELAANRDRLAASGIDIRAAKPGDIVPLLDFVRTEFSPDWHREASDLLRDQFVAGSHSIGLIVARRGNEVLGYAQHRHERFGPFGVRSDQRGNGVGGVILATTLLEMRQRALHTAWFLWTDANAARLYSRFGFEQVRQFSILELHLDDCSPTNAAMTPGAIIGT